MPPSANAQRRFIVTSVLVVTVALVIQIIRIMMINGGTFIYTLDDPYIHLALAEEILHGTYGINAGEVSAPSSSILWPFIMAAMGAWEYAPLVVNILAALATTALYAHIVYQLTHATPTSWFLRAAVMLTLVVCTNIIGLVTTGMEHSLQVLLTVLAMWGMVRTADTRMPRWLVPVLVVAPLIRYELLAIVLPSIALLWWWSERRAAVLVLIGVLCGVGGFSALLLSHGLDAVPTSVRVKSAVIDTHGTIHQLWLSLRDNLKHRQAVVLLLGAAALLAGALRDTTLPRYRALAGASVVAIALHLLGGRFGWFYRYEAYMMAWMLVGVVALYAAQLRSVVQRIITPQQRMVTAVLTGLVLLAAGEPYIQGVASTPAAASNIHLQQYQMHRFVRDYWQSAVAVNDIGWVSYRNPYDVLDLWGLASRTALEERRRHAADTTGRWMNNLVQKRGIALAMIYDDWFAGVPASWVRVGTFHLQRPLVISVNSNISCYATSAHHVSRIREALHAFAPQLPSGVVLEFAL